MNVLEIQHLSKQFGSHQVLRDLNFQVPEHSVYGFLGQNGAGKTTTMKIILGLLKADKSEGAGRTGALRLYKDKPQSGISAGCA